MSKARLVITAVVVEGRPVAQVATSYQPVPGYVAATPFDTRPP